MVTKRQLRKLEKSLDISNKNQFDYYNSTEEEREARANELREKLKDKYKHLQNESDDNLSEKEQRIKELSFKTNIENM